MLVFQNPHLLDGDFVQFNQTLALRNTLVDEYGIEVLHIRQANQLIYGGIVTNVAFLVSICLTPLLGCHAKHGYIQYVSLVGLDDACLLRSHLFGDYIAFDGIGVYAVVDFRKFSLGGPAYLLLFFLFKALELLNKIEFERDAYRRAKFKGNVPKGICSTIFPFFNDNSNSTSLFNPLRNAQDEIWQTGLHSKVVKFDHFKIGVVYHLPRTEKLYGVTVA